MKKIRLSIAFLAMFAMIFTSCSKEETGPVSDTEKATLTFGAIVNDLVTNRSAEKQSVGNIPECSSDAPAFVEVVVSQNGTNIVGSTSNPFRINLVAGQIFTEDVDELELVPGNYSLDHFTVHNSSGDLIWIAPKSNSALAGYVDSSLPLNIDLNSGVKKYVDVSVLCFDNRNVNEYGYLFFDLDTNEAIEFCVFGNFCPPSGRHYPASYSVSVWYGTSAAGGTPMYTDVSNVTGTYDNGDFYADPLCFALPDRDGLDEYYFEITLRSNDEYGQVEERVIRRGVINDDEVRNFFDGENNLDYYHFRQGCDGVDSPPIFQNPEVQAEYYKTCLKPLNDSGALALAYFELKDNVLNTTVLATGMEPNQVHPQHIHGFTDGTDAVCPPDSADANGDGIITLTEGIPFYGGVLLELEDEAGNYPTADSDGNYIFQRTFNVGSLSLPDLERTAVVAHGLSLGGEYEATLPVACGEVSKLD